MGLAKFAGGGFSFPSTVTQPSLSSVDVAAGIVDGGTLLTITGANLNLIEFDILAIRVCGVVADSPTYVNATTVTCVTAPGIAGLGDIVLDTEGHGDRTIANAFTYVDQITATECLPASGNVAGGDTITILGSGFAGVTITGVTFGGVAATGITPDDDTRFTCVNPAHAAGVVDVIVTPNIGTPVTIVGGFEYEP